MTIPCEYDKDFYAWALKSATLMRERRFSEIDVDHIAEELESRGKSEKRELINRLSILLAHLLKWRYQAAKRTRSRKNTIMTQRLDINDLLEDSPSLNSEIQRKIEKAYQKSLLIAENETGINKVDFPQVCPFSLEQMLQVDYFPNGDEDA